MHYPSHNVFKTVSSTDRTLRPLPSHILAVHKALVEEIMTRRTWRDDFLGSGLFADPAWDMLLALYRVTLEQQRIATSELGRKANVPYTTAIRWITNLENDGWIMRRPDPLDQRRIFVELSKDGLAKLTAYFDRLVDQSGVSLPV